VLVIAGQQKGANESVEYLYRGIAGRTFERRFQLADFIKVAGAQLVNGLLHVDLAREVPEAMQPRSIKIETKPAAGPQAIDSQAA
ncbi:MAG: Hsp20 family protein, partial [Rhodospirillales bacterium]|nr:Hsp20 family protein [Rhodospirillales bacterium]